MARPQRWVWKTPGLVKHYTGVSVVLRPPALDGDSWVFVLEIHVQLG